MCKNIAQKGPQTPPLLVYNRTTSKATTFAESLGPSKASVASSIPDLLESASTIFICVGDDHAVDEIVSAILLTSTDLSSKLIVDCSTVHPDTSRRISESLSMRGASFVACPVFGAPAFADDGQLIVVPAGPAEAVSKLKPFLDGVTARATIDLSGQDVGRASLLKVFGNTFILNTVETLAEGLVAAEKSGLGAEAYQQWVEMMFPGPFAKYAERMTSGDYYRREEPLFAVDLARKDLRHATSLAADSGVRMRSVEVTDRFLRDVKAERGEKGDIAAVYGAVRKHSGLEFENK